MKKTIVSIISLLALAFVANAQSTISYSYYHGSETTGVWGTDKAETYNIAVRIDDASLVGKTVKSITIPIVTDAANAKEYSAFLTHELKVSAGKAVADITSASFEPDGQWTKVTFSEPYVIEEGGFYAGYTFKVSSVSDKYDKAPVLLMVGNTPDGLYIATSRTYRKWAGMASSINGNCPLQIEVEGDFHELACGVASVANTRVKAGDAFSVQAVIANYGTTPINDITYKYTLDNGTERKEFGGSLTLPEPLGSNFYGETKNISIDIPAGISTKCTYNGTLEITEINGTANPEASMTGKNTVRFMSIVPIKRPVMEEFTGTWCGWCPRGWMAMKLMNEKYPDSFIAVSYHNGDIMQIHDGSSDPYPVSVSGFPYANLDRVHGTDPYFGDSDKDMGIEDLWKARCEVEAPAAIVVNAFLSDDDKILATAKVTFAENLEDAPYRVAYMVTADGLTGETEDWIQSSYFSGQSGYGSQMDMFTQGASSMLLTYDDVLIANSEYRGVEGSLPASVSDGQEVEHSYQFALSDMVSTYDKDQYNLVQDKNKLNVIALMVNYATGEIVNAVKCHVKTAAAIDKNIVNNTSKTVESAEFYDISGRKLSSAPERGIYIKTVKYTDGTKEIRKIRK